MKLSYYDVQDLIFVKTQFSTFIQTDKAMYKAGDLINFRVFAVDSETRPYNLNSAVVTIFDSTDIKIKIFPNVTFVKGTYENSLQLSESPSLGNWRIRIESGTIVSLILSSNCLLRFLPMFWFRSLIKPSKCKNTCCQLTQFALTCQVKLRSLIKSSPLKLQLNTHSAKLCKALLSSSSRKLIGDG